MKKLLCATLTFFLILTIFPNVTYAETDPNWGSQTPNITVPYNNYNDTWSLPMRTAAATWNSSSANVTIATSDSSPNNVIATSYSDTFYGQATSANPGPFTIRLNSRTITRDATNFSNFVKSVMIHEYGHIFCLDHTSTIQSIMYEYRDRNSMIVPQQFDINEVNSVYKK